MDSFLVHAVETDIVIVDVGGTIFKTTRVTLKHENDWQLNPSSGRMFGLSSTLYFDADPRVFEWILLRLRSCCALPYPKDLPCTLVQQQLLFWGLDQWIGQPFVDRWLDVEDIQPAVQFLAAGNKLSFIQFDKRVRNGRLMKKEVDQILHMDCACEILQTTHVERLSPYVSWQWESFEGAFYPIWAEHNVSLTALWAHENLRMTPDLEDDGNISLLLACLVKFHCRTAEELLAHSDMQEQFPKSCRIVRACLDDFENLHSRFKSRHAAALTIRRVMLQQHSHTPSMAQIRFQLKVLGLNLVIKRMDTEPAFMLDCFSISHSTPLTSDSIWSDVFRDEDYALGVLYREELGGEQIEVYATTSC
jgi:hypothetical protein